MSVLTSLSIWLIPIQLLGYVSGETSWSNETCWFNAVYTQYGYPRMEPQARDLDYCTWYNDNTCCASRADEEDGSQSDFFWGYPYCPKEAACEDLMELFFCGQCSPKYLDYFDKKTNKLRICKDFANQIWKKCKFSGVQFGDTSLDFITNGFGSGCYVPAGVAKNPKQMVENGFNAVYTDNDCFNAGHQLPYFGLLIFAGIVGIVLL